MMIDSFNVFSLEDRFWSFGADNLADDPLIRYYGLFWRTDTKLASYSS